MELCVLAEKSFFNSSKVFQKKLFASYSYSLFMFSSNNITVVIPGKYQIYLILAGKSSILLKKYSQTLVQNSINTPILLYLQKASSKDRAYYLSVGVKDCLSGKVCTAELECKINLFAKELPNIKWQKQPFFYQNFTFCFIMKKALYKDKEIYLNNKETQLLEYLLIKINTTVPREILYQNVWPNGETPCSNALETHFSSLRRKIEKPYGLKLFKTVWGIGYRAEIN